MSRPVRLTFSIVVALAVVAAVATPAEAKPKLTYQQIAALPLDQQTALLNPLRTVASAANAVGTGVWNVIYSGVRIDAPADRVVIYLTDPSRAAEFLDATRTQNPSADLSLATVEKSTYTLVALKAAASALFARADLGLESVAVPADGNELRVRAANVASTKAAISTPAVRSAAQAAGTILSSVPIVVEQAQGTQLYSRLRDTPSWISGEALSESSDSEGQIYTCTSGLPARRSDGHSFLMTAAHCYANGHSVYTGWQFGGRNFIGTVAYRDSTDDAIAIDTGSTGVTRSTEWDGGCNPNGSCNVYDVTGTDFSFEGDLVCQDGYASGIVCGLKVLDSTFNWHGAADGNINHYGAEVQQVNGGIAGRGGDSGGLVFALVGNNVREARGMVSGGNGGSLMYFGHAPLILGYFGFTLAP